MERYKLIKEVGDGAFGSVWRAINKLSGEVVAIKKMKKKYYSWEECVNLREVKSLRRMNHPNIVKLKEVIRENDIVYFVFEYMERNLYQLMKDRGKLFSEVEIRNWCFQVFQGLAYMHQRGYFHRDLKPENLLVTKDIIKIADFGLAREISSHPPYTEYVSTRCEADEIYKICSVIGSPIKDSWLDGLNLARVINYQFPQFAGVPLSMLIPSASDDAINLITSLCSWDPCKRPSAAEALQHPFFQSCFYVPPSLHSGAAVSRTPLSVGVRGTLEQQAARRYSGVLPTAELTSSLSSLKTNASLDTGVQCKLDMVNNKNDKSLKNSAKQPRYRPPQRKSPTTSMNKDGTASGTCDVKEKFANMTIGNRRQYVGQLRAPAMKTGTMDCRI